MQHSYKVKIAGAEPATPTNLDMKYYALATGYFRHHLKDIVFFVNDGGKHDTWKIKYRYRDDIKKLINVKSRGHVLTQLEGKPGVDIRIVSEEEFIKELFLYKL